MNHEGSERTTHTQNGRESIPIIGTRACKGHNLGKCRNREKTKCDGYVSSRDLGNNLSRLAAKDYHIYFKNNKDEDQER